MSTGFIEPSETKPEFLYHGSPYLNDILKPQQARSLSGIEVENLQAIYAAETFNLVIPWAFPIRWYPDNPSGKKLWHRKSGMVIIEQGTLNPEGFGYVYKVRAEGFKKIDDWQWVSAKETIPIESTKIWVKDYWDIVIFLEEAQMAQRQLYPSSAPSF